MLRGTNEKDFVLEIAEGEANGTKTLAETACQLQKRKRFNTLRRDKVQVLVEDSFLVMQRLHFSTFLTATLT